MEERKKKKHFYFFYNNNKKKKFVLNFRFCLFILLVNINLHKKNNFFLFLGRDEVIHDNHCG